MNLIGQSTLNFVGFEFRFFVVCWGSVRSLYRTRMALQAHKPRDLDEILLDLVSGLKSKLSHIS